MASGFRLKPLNAANSTFHVTVHGIHRIKVFGSEHEKSELLARFRNHLSPERTVDASRRPHFKLTESVAVLAFCVLDNHLHLVLHQFSSDGIRQLMSRVLSSYGRHFNRERGWRGPVFDGRYAAKQLDEADPDYLKNMIAYVELNDSILQFDNPFSSHRVICGDRACSWLDVDRTLRVFGGIAGYREHMNRVGPSIVRKKLITAGVNPDLHPYRPI